MPRGSHSFIFQLKTVYPLIRFITSKTVITAYFNNFLILSAFLGLGFGSLLAVKKYDFFSLFPISFALMIVIMSFLGHFGYHMDLSENIISEASGVKDLAILPGYLLILFVFGCNFLFFIPLGVRLGQSLKAFENRLTAYAFDLLGSILGVTFFTVISYVQTRPYIWFSISGMIAFLLLEKNKKTLGYSLFLLVGIVASAASDQGKWSPYYNVTWDAYKSRNEGSQEFLGYVISVDRIRIQDALRFSETFATHPKLGSWIPYYRLPYHFCNPKKVLVLGGGSGNDATMALLNGAERADVVEIDPVIMKFGYYLHPHRPYLDSRVRTINDDARSFLRRCDEKYDLIIMNALDSHHQLPGLSTLRHESFIFTVEAFEAVKEHMDETSIFLLHSASYRTWIGERLYWSLTKAFGVEPRLYTTADSPFSSIAFISGHEELLRHNRLPEKETVLSIDPEPFQRVKSNVVLSTDNWPHLYLSKPQVPTVYIYILSAVTLLTIIALIGIGSLSGIVSYINLFFLGAGFMLLETRSITSVALFFGSTWIVNAIVIGSILVLISVGNLLILLNLRISLKLCYLGLFFTLVVGYLISAHFILEFPYITRVIPTAIWFGLPILFASFIFSYSFRDVPDTATAFGANLLGVVVGGTIEYSSMVFGLNSLYVFAILLYACALFSDRKFKSALI